MKPAVCGLRTIFRIFIVVTLDSGYANISYSVHEHTYTAFLNIDTIVLMDQNLIYRSDQRFIFGGSDNREDTHKKVFF